MAWQLVVKISTTPELRENPELLKILYEMNDRFLTSNYRLKEHQYRV